MHRIAFSVVLAISLCSCVEGDSETAHLTVKEALSAPSTPLAEVPGHPELGVLRAIHAKLRIELSAPPVHIENTANLRATPDATIAALHLDAMAYAKESTDLRILTAQELNAPAFNAPRIRLRGEAGTIVEHLAPNGAYFTIADMLTAIESTERNTRNSSRWFGGVDIHHVYFEGLELKGDGVWDIVWGS